MIFVCGTVDHRGSSGLEHTLERMTAARHSARSGTVGTRSFEGGAIAHAHCVVTQAVSGDSTAFLFRPAGEDRVPDATTLGELIAAYQHSGHLAVASLAGVFLLVVIDRRRATVALACDRFGICPLYFHTADQYLVFSTDLDALAAHPQFSRKVDRQAVYDYVFFHCIPSPRTIYQGVAKLGPAATLIWAAGGVRQSTYWQPAFAPADVDADTLGAELVSALEEAVRNRARPHCGAFLSGGLDSSSVAGMLRRTQGRAATFTIGFDAAGYDESAYARTAARHFGTEHHEYFVTPADVRESLPAIAAHYGEPFGNSSVLPTYHCARFAREHGIELMLAGDGGDELFAGNTRYTEQRIFEAYFKVPGPLRALLEGAYRLLPLLEDLPVAGKGARYIQQARMGLPDRLQSYNFLNRFDPRKVFAADWLHGVDTESPWRLWRQRFAEPVSANTLQRMLYLDWKFTLADNDLVKVTRMCDLAGVEVCYPMLDDAVVMLADRIDPAVLLLDGQLRGFYKQAFAHFLPREIIAKAKHGFGLPFGVWMREDQGLKDMVAAAFAGLRQRDIFRREFLDEAQRLYQEEDAAGYYGELAWILTMLELWFGAHAGINF